MTNHELRSLEELYCYTYDEKSRYISHLKEELRKDGYISDDRVKKTFYLKKILKIVNFIKKQKYGIIIKLTIQKRKRRL